MKSMKRAATWIKSHIDGRDILGMIGVGLLGYGGETLHPGAGYAAAGALLVAVAVLVR